MKGIITAIVLLLLWLGVLAVIHYNNLWPNPNNATTTATSTTTSTYTYETPAPTGTTTQGILPYNSGVNGTITVGPTCPVMRNPPDPGCDDRPLSTLVAIFRASDPVHAYVITRSDASGHFSASLAPGAYIIGAGENTLPRCPQTPVTIEPSKYASATIKCDSGIR